MYNLTFSWWNRHTLIQIYYFNKILVLFFRYTSQWRAIIIWIDSIFKARVGSCNQKWSYYKTESRMTQTKSSSKTCNRWTKMLIDVRHLSLIAAEFLFLIFYRETRISLHCCIVINLSKDSPRAFNLLQVI